MAFRQRFKIAHDEYFHAGAFILSPVTPVFDFDRSTKDNKIQQVDKDTGLLLWQIDVLDADPEANKAMRTVTVKFAAKVQPVPPHNDGPSPFTPVEFVGLTALMYVQQQGDFSRVMLSFRATDMVAPGKAPAAAPSGGSTPSASKAA